MLAVVVIIGCLLAAQPLKASAENVSSPILRSVALAIARPLAGASDFLHLGEAREWVVATVGGATGDAEANAESTSDAVASSADGLDTGGQDPASPPATSPSQGGSPPVSGAGPSATPVTPPASTAPSTLVPNPPSSTAGAEAAGAEAADTKKVVTHEDPLRVLIVGDSLVLQVGHGVTRWSEKLPLQTKVVSKPSSGLSRPDFFNWPATLKKTVAEFQPHVTVMMFGNNDKQDVTVDGRRLQRFTPEWLDVYRSRVKAALTIAKDAGSRVVWVGMPIMRSAKFAETARTFNKVYSSVCAGEGASYVDTYALFSDADGRYTPYLPDTSGKRALMRSGDGIHLTEAGGDRVAAEIVEALRQHYQLVSADHE
jgi:hypothetical protein